MFRKLSLALVAVVTLSAPAFAFGGVHLGGGHFGGHFGGGHFIGSHFGGGHFYHGGFFRGGIYAVGYSCYRTIWTDFGPRRIYVCG
jgi:hypothetical protein